MPDKEEIKEEEIIEEQAEQEAEEEAQEPDKAKEWEDKYIRLYAEFDNFKKRSQREKDARYGDAVIDTVSELITVADNLERALAVEAENEETVKFKEGVSMVYKQMQDTLSKLGVTEIKALGEQFYPNLHNAVMHIEDETLGENVIADVLQKGYKIGDTVIRAAMVKVAN